LSLSKLGLDDLDLYLIHWPAACRGLYEETWLTLIDLQREGLVRSIGVEAVSLRLSDEEMDAIAGLDRGERIGRI
jgi:2,5-diketo-D-gluconate reductase A